MGCDEFRHCITSFAISDEIARDCRQMRGAMMVDLNGFRLEKEILREMLLK